MVLIGSAEQSRRAARSEERRSQRRPTQISPRHPLCSWKRQHRSGASRESENPPEGWSRLALRRRNIHAITHAIRRSLPKFPSDRVMHRDAPTCMAARLSRGHLNHRRMSTRNAVAGIASTRIVERSETVAGGHHQPDGEPSVMSATHAGEQPPAMHGQASLTAPLRPDTRRIECRRTLQRSVRSRVVAGLRGHRIPLNVPVGHVRSLTGALKAVVGLLRTTASLCPVPPQVSKPSKMER